MVEGVDNEVGGPFLGNGGGTSLPFSFKLLLLLLFDGSAWTCWSDSPTFSAFFLFLPFFFLSVLGAGFLLFDDYIINNSFV